MILFKPILVFCHGSCPFSQAFSSVHRLESYTYQSESLRYHGLSHCFVGGLKSFFEQLL